MKRPPATTVGAVGVAAGCAGMVSMLPGAVAGALGAIGISGSSALARTLSPVAEPLFILSAIVVTIGGLLCSRLVALLAVGGSVCMYLSMFQLGRGRADRNRRVDVDDDAVPAELASRRTGEFLSRPRGSAFGVRG